MMMFIFVSNFLFARVEFQSLRQDLTMPSHCVDLAQEHFDEKHQKVIYGIEGAKEKGFTHELPLERQEARDMWQALNGNRASEEVIHANPELREMMHTLQTKGVEMGFDYGKEGDVLEVLALVDLEATYPDTEYFRTGGYEYSNGRGPVVGELDVLVGRKSDCKIIVIGEAKLGHKMLSKAKEQLHRFENFYQREAFSFASK